VLQVIARSTAAYCGGGEHVAPWMRVSVQVRRLLP